MAQSISPSVINSGGKTTTTTLNSQTVIYTDNIGEAVIGTGSTSGNILTQGFLQPDMIVVKNTSVTVFSSNVTCADKGDGYIYVDVVDLPLNATVQYFWTPTNTLCASGNCSRRDSLSQGTFTVRTVWTFTVGTTVKKDSTVHIINILDNNGICNIKVYTGIHQSGSNTKFTIDNIEAYPDAEVSIYNRWGRRLFSTKEYGKDKNKMWPADGEKVISGTYFYIIDTGKGKANKGWVEVFD